MLMFSDFFSGSRKWCCFIQLSKYKESSHLQAAYSS
jgi:hypothetical protein